MKPGKFSAMMAGASALSLTIGVMSAPPVMAQEATSVVTGEVTRSGETTFSGVVVAIEGTGIEATTGADGGFRLPNVPPGTYTLVLSFLGETLERRTIDVVAGTPVNLDIDLDQRTLDRVVVTGTRGALNNARAQERSIDNLTSIVTADDIGQFADQNIAESLQRLPGLTINRDEGEGRQVAIRGLSGSFVTVTVDGVRLGARDEDNRSVDLDVLSSDLLNGIEVSKTLTPDQDADSIAGSVDLKTLSAFARGDDSISGRLEYGYQDKSEDWNPRISGDFTKIFDLNTGGQLGIAGGLSWQNRKSLVDEISHDDGLIVFAPDGDGGFEDFGQDWDDVLDAIEDGETSFDQLLYLPARVNLRSDPAERTRLSGNLNIEYRPSESLELFLRGTAAQFEDDDLRNRQRVRLDRSGGGEILAFDVTSGSFEDSRSERRIRFSQQEDMLYSISTGGEWSNDLWTVDGQVDYSKNESDIPSFEPRFRADNFRVDFANLSGDGIDLAVSPEEGTTYDDEVDSCVDRGLVAGDDAYDPNNPCAYEYRFTTNYDFYSEDTIEAAKLNVQRDFSFNERPAFLKVGVKLQERERDYDVFRLRTDTGSIDDLAEFSQCGTLTGQSFDFFVNPCLDEVRAFGVSERNGDPTPLLADEVISLARDYNVVEEINSAYLMGKFALTDRLEVIAGFRVEDTTWSTQSGFTNQVSFSDTVSENFYAALTGAGVTDAEILASSLGERYVVAADGSIELDEGVPVVVEDLIDFRLNEDENSYTDWFPNLNIRWEPTDQLIFRFSYTEAIQRPDFNQAAGNGGNQLGESTGDVAEEPDQLAVTTIAEAEALVQFDADFGGGLRIRDPFLDPLEAKQYDASVSWYPNQDTFLQAAFFYKDIENFIFPLTSEDIGAFGFAVSDLTEGRDVAIGDVSVESWINGDSAEVYGVELSYSQNYTFLPGIWSGLFTYANLTLAESEATDSLIDRPFQLPEQADVSGNISLGWENDDISLRLSGNYVGERLRVLNEGRLGTDVTQSDLLEDERFSLDFNARWQINDNYQVYLDAVNINDAQDVRFFDPGGQTGQVLGVVEDYGATYQIGVRARF